jgi:rare lipoprotein A
MLPLLLPLAALAGCATQQQQARAPSPPTCMQVGTASWYQPTGAKTASGEVPGPGTLIAAHRTLPFGTRVRVTDVTTGKSVVVRVGDRGPFAKDRIIDLPSAAAAQLGIKTTGVTQVRLELEQTAADAATPAACPFNADTSA